MKHSEQLDKILPALGRFQAAMKPIPKNDTNPHFSHRFTNLEGIQEAIQPLLTENQLIVTQTMCVLPDGSSGMTTTVWHASGQFISGEMPLLLAKEDPQGQGSGITYARRYALAALLNLVQADDDGNQATQSRQAQRPQQQQQRTQQPSQQQQRRPKAPPCPSCGNEDSTHKSTRGDGFYCNPKSQGCGRAFNAEEGEPDPSPRSDMDDELDRIFST